MKVIHVPYCFAPEPMGGTEIYAAALAQDLQNLDVENVIAAPAATTNSYTFNGLRVRRFRVALDNVDLRQLHGLGDPGAAAEFDKILADEKPDLVHLHAFTQGVSVRLARAVKQRKLPVVFTYHTPTVSCQRGTLMRWGTTLCDGKLHVRHCSGCTLHGLGLMGPLAIAVGAVPPWVGRSLGNAALHGKVWTALRMSELTTLRHTMFRSLMTEVDHVVAVCGWVRDVLLLNEVPPSKITLCRHGIRLIVNDAAGPAVVPPADSKDQLRIAFLGRYDQTKGIEVLIHTLRMDQSLKARLDIYGVVQSAANERYRQKMFALAANDPRISFRDPVPSHEVVALLRGYDLLAVPSQWLETGPQVALEAFAAGIPVIGWDIGGIAEIVKHEIDGLLIDPKARHAWTDALRHLIKDRALLAKLKAGVRQPRTSVHVAREMSELYRSLLKAKSRGQQGLHSLGILLLPYLTAATGCIA
jgi:glycosyltransferase involved in cell wall biosynthesis